MRDNQTITAIPGLLAGHATDADNHTGCTAVICPEGFTPGVFLPGFAPGTREVELMRPENTVDAVHGLVLAGGSAYGLATADGVTRFLRERGHGFVMPGGVVPIVGGAVVYDLDVNRRPGLLPDAEMGYRAAAGASNAPLAQGGVGAGAGTRCGRMFASGGVKAGTGCFLSARDGILVGALVVMNALGNVHDPESGVFISGGLAASGKPHTRDEIFTALAASVLPQSNTVLAVVAVNVPLNKPQCSRLARMAASGISRAVRPAHLPFDGDIVFCLSAKRPLPPGCGPWTESLLGAMAAEAVGRAALNSALSCSTRR